MYGGRTFGASNVISRPWLIVVAAASVAHPTIAAGEDAGALLAAGRAAEAADAARKCAEPRCGLVLGRALFALGQLGAAAEALAKARPGLGPLEAHAAQLEGEALLLAGRAREAMEPLRAALARDPEGPPGLRAAAVLADALFATGDLPGAHAQAERAAAMPGQHADVRAGLAWTAAQALGRSAEGARALRNFWLEHPEHPAAETARAMELEMAQLPPPGGRELLLRASRLLLAGKPAAAVAQSEVAAGELRGEERAEAQLLHARALAADGRRSEAAPSLQEAWAEGAAHVAAQAGMLLARDRARRGNDAEAIKLADAVARKYPAAPEAEESVLFSARLEADAGRRGRARTRLAKLAARRSGPNASAARWQLAWMSYRDQLRDAAERFAEFAASAASDEERAQGHYWQARAGKGEAAILRRAAELDPLGWYGLLARERLGEAAAAPAPFPPRRAMPEGALPPRLALGMDLVSLGLLAEAAAEADCFVQRHAGDAGALALAVYERAGRYDRSVAIAEALLGNRGARAPRELLYGAYPAAFPAEVARSARLVRLDPYLLLAVMRRESLFKPDTRSAAGAVGLLQLLPATARRAAMVLGRPPLRDDQLVVPATAIDLGAWYLAELVGRFGDPAVALAAYNAGPRVAGPWAVRGAGRRLDEWVEDIPYRETRKYVKIVVGAWSAYRILAGGSAPQISATVPAPKLGADF
jgi:soluble lytic murein transglycosylase